MGRIYEQALKDPSAAGIDRRLLRALDRLTVPFDRADVWRELQRHARETRTPVDHDERMVRRALDTLCLAQILRSRAGEYTLVDVQVSPDPAPKIGPDPVATWAPGHRPGTWRRAIEPAPEVLLEPQAAPLEGSENPEGPIDESARPERWRRILDMLRAQPRSTSELRAALEVPDMRNVLRRMRAAGLIVEASRASRGLVAGKAGSRPAIIWAAVSPATDATGALMPQPLPPPELEIPASKPLPPPEPEPGSLPLPESESLPLPEPEPESLPLPEPPAPVRMNPWVARPKHGPDHLGRYYWEARATLESRVSRGLGWLAESEVPGAVEALGSGAEAPDPRLDLLAEIGAMLCLVPGRDKSSFLRQLELGANREALLRRAREAVAAERESRHRMGAHGAALSGTGPPWPTPADLQQLDSTRLMLDAIEERLTRWRRLVVMTYEVTS